MKGHVVEMNLEDMEHMEMTSDEMETAYWLDL